MAKPPPAISGRRAVTGVGAGDRSFRNVGERQTGGPGVGALAAEGEGRGRAQAAAEVGLVVLRSVHWRSA